MNTHVLLKKTTFQKHKIASKLLLFGLAFFSAMPMGICQSKQHEVDSLEQVFQNAVEDTVKMETLSNLAVAVMYSNLEQSKAYTRQLIAIADRNKDTYRLASAYLSLSSYYYQGGGIDSMRLWAEHAIAVLNHPEDKKWSALEGRAYTHLGIAAYSDGHFNKALEYYEEAETRVTNELIKTQNSFNIGVVLKELGDYGGALDYFSKAKEQAVKAGWKTIEPVTLTNIGEIYSLLQEYDKAVEFYLKAIKIREELKDEHGLLYSLVGLADTYSHFDLKKAKERYQLCLDKSRQLENEDARVVALVNFSKFYINQNQPDSALALTNAGYSIVKNYPDGNIRKSETLRNYAAIYNLKKEYAKALTYARAAVEGYRMAEETSGKFYLDALFAYAQSLQNTGSPAAAIEVLMERDSLNELRNTEQQKTATAGAEVKFRLREKELEFEKTEQENELKIVKAESRQKFLMALLGGAGLLLLLGIFFYRRIQKDKNTIALQKAQVEASLGEKEVLLKEIHHRVKNNLQIISGLLDKQARKATDETVKKLMREGQDRVQSMALIHQNLYQSDNLSGIEIKSYLEELTKNISQSQMAGRNVDVLLDVDDSKLDIDTAIPVGLILNELITNAFKYAFVGKESGAITIDFKNVGKHFLMSVKDNGIGLPKDFEVAKAKSLGLSLVRGLVRQLDGEMNFGGTSEGTSFELRF